MLPTSRRLPWTAEATRVQAEGSPSGAAASTASWARRKASWKALASGPGPESAPMSTEQAASVATNEARSEPWAVLTPSETTSTACRMVPLRAARLSAS